MKPDKIFIGNIKRCTKYISHSRFTGNVFIGEECVSLNSFGYIESEDELYKENAVLVKLTDRLSGVIPKRELSKEFIKNNKITIEQEDLSKYKRL